MSSFPSDADLVEAAENTYNPSASWTRTCMVDGVAMFILRVQSMSIVAFRGSLTPRDWLRDFRGWPKKHPKLGYCHEGFLKGMDEAVSSALGFLRPSEPVAVTGHSLGAAHALIAAALFALEHVQVLRVVTFGAPRPGFYQLSDILRMSGAQIVSYKNGPDPVADVPIALGPLWPYQKPVKDTAIGREPRLKGDPFAWHHIDLYAAGVKALAI